MSKCENCGGYRKNPLDPHKSVRRHNPRRREHYEVTSRSLRRRNPLPELSEIALCKVCGNHYDAVLDRLVVSSGKVFPGKFSVCKPCYPYKYSWGMVYKDFLQRSELTDEDMANELGWEESILNSWHHIDDLEFWEQPGQYVTSGEIAAVKEIAERIAVPLRDLRFRGDLLQAVSSEVAEHNLGLNIIAKICPRCGGPKSKPAKLCKDCAGSARIEATEKRLLAEMPTASYTCACGANKAFTAKRCQKCHRIFQRKAMEESKVQAATALQRKAEAWIASSDSFIDERRDITQRLVGEARKSAAEGNIDNEPLAREIRQEIRNFGRDKSYLSTIFRAEKKTTKEQRNVAQHESRLTGKLQHELHRALELISAEKRSKEEHKRSKEEYERELREHRKGVQMFSMANACRILNIALSTLRRYIQEGLIHQARVFRGSYGSIAEQELIDFIKSDTYKRTGKTPLPRRSWVVAQY